MCMSIRKFLWSACIIVIWPDPWIWCCYSFKAQIIPRSSQSYILYHCSVSVKVFDINATRCWSPFESICVRTAPDAYLDASNSIWKGHVWSSIIKTGSSVNLFFRVKNASWHSDVYSKGTFFFNKPFNGMAISENFHINFW